MSGTQQHKLWPWLHIKYGTTFLQYPQLLTHCSWGLQVKVSIQLMQSLFMRWRNEGNEGYDPNRVTSPREGGGLGSGDLLY